MNILPKNSSDLHPDDLTAIARGASSIASDGANRAALWTQNTPRLHDQPTATIGACRLTNTTAASTFLRDCVDHLFSTNDAAHVLAPMDENTWLKHRLIIESDGRPPFLMEPIEPAHYAKTFEHAGFSILSTYSSSAIDLTTEPAAFRAIESRIDAQHITIRPLNMNHLEADLCSIHRLSLTAFADNFLYTPLAENRFIKEYLSQRDHIDPRYVLLAEQYDKLIGFVFCLPEPTLPKRLIVKTLAVDPNSSAKGLGTLLVHRVQHLARQHGFTSAIHALQFENNTSLRISARFNAHKFRTYALMAFARPLNLKTTN